MAILNKDGQSRSIRFYKVLSIESAINLKSWVILLTLGNKIYLRITVEAVYHQKEAGVQNLKTQFI